MIRLDPRTQLGLMIVANVVLYSAGFSGGALSARIIFMILPAVLMFGAQRWRAAFGYSMIMTLALWIETSSVAESFGSVTLLIGGLAGLVVRVAPGFFLAYVAVTTMRVSELMAALEAWRVPKQLTIPFAVVLRFAPTVHQTAADIATAMRSKGLTLRRVGIGDWVEYRLAPLIIATVKSAEELSQAALTRGLGRPGVKTRIAQVGFGWFDFAVVIAAICGVTALMVVP